MSPALESGFLTTGPSGKSLDSFKVMLMKHVLTTGNVYVVTKILNYIKCMC